MKPVFFHPLDVDPDELAALCFAKGFDVELVRIDSSREGYGYAVRERGSGAYFIHERLSGGVYRVFAEG